MLRNWAVGFRNSLVLPPLRGSILLGSDPGLTPLSTGSGWHGSSRALALLTLSAFPFLLPLTALSGGGRLVRVTLFGFGGDSQTRGVARGHTVSGWKVCQGGD